MADTQSVDTEKSGVKEEARSLQHSEPAMGYDKQGNFIKAVASTTEKTSETVEKTEAEQAAPEKIIEESAPSEIKEEVKEKDNVYDKVKDKLSVEEIKSGKWVPQERVDEITAARRNAEREAEYWKNKSMESTPPETKVEAPKEPTIADYPDIESYITAKVKWERQKERAEDFQTQELGKRYNRFGTAVEEFSKVHSDFSTVALNPTLTITPFMKEALVDEPRGPEVAYYLGKNPDEAKRISKLPPMIQVMEIGKLGERLAVKVSPKITTEAPKPLKPVTGTTEIPRKEAQEMTMEEYAAANENRFKWKGRK